MTPRERYLESILFGSPDKVYFKPGGARESTRKQWYKQGLDPEVKDYNAHAYRLAGGKEELPGSGPGFSVNYRMKPYFEEKVIEERESSRIVQDWKGNVCEISNEYTTEYLRNAIDFVTRRWLKCPVENRDDWEDMKSRYDAEDPERLPEDAAQKAQQLSERDYPLILHFDGPFWVLREWMGFEPLCMAFYDDPDFVNDMIQFWEDYVARLLERAFEYVKPDCVHLSEDMAYKNFSMISPDMVRSFLLPTWRRWGGMIKDADVPVYGMDSDGYVGELIPIWIDAGINCCDPMEVAAGNDLNLYRKEFGKQMAFQGGVDKRAMACGGETLRNEIERVKPVIKDGGYIPACDHGVPSNVSWQNYVEYVRLLAEATGWL